MGSAGSSGTSSRQIRARTRHAVAAVALVSLWLWGASTAGAAPFIPFDAPTAGDGFSYGFVDPGNYGITDFRQMNDFYTAAPSGTAEAASSLLVVDPVDFERCPRSSDNCDGEFHVFDVVWDVTFNADVLPNPNAAYEVDLILVDSDPNRIFRNNRVEVDYASAELDGASLDFETARFVTGSADYYFIDAALGSMLDGDTKQLAFSYRVFGELPLAGGGDVGFLFPQILPAAFLPIPEPGTASMLGLGLGALAMRKRRQRP